MNKLLAMLVLAAPALLNAQTGETVRLSDPVMKRAPANAEWTVQFQENRDKMLKALAKGTLVVEGDDAKDAATRQMPLSITVTKDGTTYREVTHWADGRAREKWIAGDLQVYETARTAQVARSIIPTPTQYSDNYTDYRRSDFEELEWIGKDNFVGITELDGRKVLEFRANAGKRRLTPREQSELIDWDLPKSSSAEAAKPQAAGRSSYTAYLDLQTQLPVYFDDGNIVRTYKFSTSAPGGLSIPPRFAKELDSWKKQMVQRKMPKP